MNRSGFATVALLVALGIGPSARAETLFTARISHDQETVQGDFLTSTGAPRPESFGSAQFILNDAMTALTFSAVVYNIDFTGSQTADPFDNLVAAHIHAPAAPGTNGPVVWGFIGSPFNDTNPTDTVVTPFSSGVGAWITSKWDLTEGRNTTLADQIPNLKAGLAYINFHTVQFGGGEIRGQIQMVPEPSSIALSGVGAAAIALLSLRATRRGIRRR
ncbi:CHRD domain-containing protein [Tautonia sociabilis]|uniref:CHRD domain-containing protein n=1 Tax=Tautonia sociabilis TaxID=2080755 RepID=A0A432MF95_9BACT|nr:CHRD domain-containing protein [Tautonia sociabilis]RUL84645.1 CHRD domain-containing protein [Tautonia sociabilis]